jgi:hypothetical protein
MPVSTTGIRATSKVVDAGMRRHDGNAAMTEMNDEITPP